MSDIIDINVYETTEAVTINVTETVIEVNVNKVTASAGGNQNLNQVLTVGNATDGENIVVSDGDSVIMDNGSRLVKGTSNAGYGGNKGIALRCSIDYEFKWEAGRLYVMEQDGFTIRETSYNFTLAPNVNDDASKGFVVGSRWFLDNGDLYICTDAAVDSAIWELQQVDPNAVHKTGDESIQGIKTFEDRVIISSDNTALNVQSFFNNAIYGQSDDYDAIIGESNSANGIHGVSDIGNGLYGYSSYGNGISAVSYAADHFNFGGNKAILKNNGNLLLNKTADDGFNKLQVQGNIWASGNFQGNYIETFGGQIETLSISELNAYDGYINYNSPYNYFDGKVLINQLSDDGNQLQIGGYVSASGYKVPDGIGLGFLKDDGTVDSNTYLTSADLSGLVPYTGAISDVNLGEFGIQLGNLEFDLTPTNAPTNVGSMVWNDTAGTLDLKLKGGNVTLQLGQETVARVVNKTATNITLLEANYQAVRVTGAIGQRPKVDLALANNDLNSTTTLGLVTETILNNQEGFITTSGQVQQINTTGSLQGETWADGDVLYLSGTIAGQITNIKPIAPIHTVILGFVEHAHINQGKIFVKVDNGYELEELHNVSAIAPNNNEVLTYDSATLLWKPKTVAFADAAGNADYWSGMDGFELSFGSTYSSDVVNLYGYNDGLGVATKFDATAVRSFLSLSSAIIGSGSTNYIPKFDASNSLTNSSIYESAGKIGIGTTMPATFLSIYNANSNFPKTEMMRMEVKNSASALIDYFKFTLGATNSRGGSIIFGETGGGFPEAGIDFNLNHTIIYQGGAYPIYLKTNNVNRLTVTGTGSFLMNQTTDDGVNKVQITGNLKVAGDALFAFSTKAIGSTLTINERTVEVTAVATITLPLPAANNIGKEYVIKNNIVAGGIVTVSASTSTIDGSITYLLSARYKYVHVVSNGTAWLIIANN